MLTFTLPHTLITTLVSRYTVGPFHSGEEAQIVARCNLTAQHNGISRLSHIVLIIAWSFFVTELTASA